MRKWFLTLLVLGMMLSVVPVQAVEPVKIGMITTLSTKAGYLGEEIRDGFQLAIDQEGGKLGGIPVELLVDDDGRKPEKAKQIADRFIQRDKVKILTGIVFSNVAIAIVQGHVIIRFAAGRQRVSPELLQCGLPERQSR